MCFDYDEDSRPIRIDKERRARKAHRCDDCGRQIKPGEVYTYGVWAHPDGVFDFHGCYICKRIRAAIYRAEIRAGCRSWESTVPYGDGVLREYLQEIGHRDADAIRADAHHEVALATTHPPGPVAGDPQ